MSYSPMKYPPPQAHLDDQGYYPGPSQPYAAGYGPQGGSAQEYKSFRAADRFKPPKRIRDPIFLLLFLASFVAYAGLSIVVISQWVKGGGLKDIKDNDNDQSKHHTITLNGDTAILLLMVTGAALLVSVIQFMITRAFTRVIMHITLVLSIALNFVACTFFWIKKEYVAAIVFTIVALFSIISYWAFRRRIPLASLLLQVVMDVSNDHLSVYVVAFTSLFLQGALSVWYIFAAFASYDRFYPGNPACSAGSSCLTGKAIALIVFETFGFLWTSQVVGNVALATLAGGPYGAWYYFGPREFGQMPNHPTLSAFGRAASFNLGSIAFGSLIVTILEMIRLALDFARSSANSTDQPILACLACCAECFIGCIENAIEYFNRYAYIEIALYGKPYIESARATFRLFKDRGIDTIVNDNLVNMVLTWGAYLVGLITALLAFVYLHFAKPSYNTNGQYTLPVTITGFLIGVVCSMTLSSSIEAGVSTIFVGLGEDPQVLAYRSPQLFEMIQQAYPSVALGIPN